MRLSHILSRRSALATTAGAALAAGLMAGPVATASALPMGGGECMDHQTVMVPGSGQSFKLLPGDQTLLRGGDNHVSNYNAMWGFGLTSYTDSRDDGIQKLSEYLASESQRCPNTTFHLVGYSEGADVAANVAASIGHGNGPMSEDRLGESVMVANPARNPNGAKERGSAAGNGGYGMGDPVDYGTVTDRITESCARGDSVCNGGEYAPLIADNAMKVGAHSLLDAPNAAVAAGETVAQDPAGAVIQGTKAAIGVAPHGMYILMDGNSSLPAGQDNGGGPLKPLSDITDGTAQAINIGPSTIVDNVPR